MSRHTAEALTDTTALTSEAEQEQAAALWAAFMEAVRKIELNPNRAEVEDTRLLQPFFGRAISFPGLGTAMSAELDRRRRFPLTADGPAMNDGTDRDADEREAEREAIAEDGPSLLSKSLLDLDENPPQPVRWIVEGLLPECALSLLFGKPFGGKSIFALQLGLHCAASVPFLPPPGDSGVGFAMPRPLRILYADEEMGLPLLCKRERMMRAGHPAFSEAEVRRRFRVISRAGLRLDDDKKLDLLRRELGDFPGGPPDLLIQDTLRRMHGAPEKDSDTMAKLTATETALAEEFGTTVLPIHHSKKGPQDDDEDWRESARGSGDLVASCQSVIAIWKTADMLFSARADAKAAGEIEPFPLLLDPQTLLYRRQSEEERFATQEAQDESAIKEAMPALCKTLRKLRESGDDKKYPASWTAWRDRTTGKGTTLAVARDRLLAEEAVRKTKRTGRGGGEIYLFPEDYDEGLGLVPRTRSREGQE